MATDTDAEMRIKLDKALADAETAKRRATLALRVARDALRYSLCTPKTAAMIRAD